MALNLIANITLDMLHPYASSTIVQVNQYDTAGSIKATLLNDGVSWNVPQGAKAVVMFKKTDNIGGFYDVTELNPESAAVTVDSNDRSIIYITLDQQTTTTATTAGQYVNMQVAFYQNGARLSTFAFYMQVQPSVVTSGDIHSNWLFNILSQEIAQILTDATTPEFISQWLENNITQETGYVIDDSLTIHGAASDAQATGKMVTVSDTNPGISANKVWVKKTPSEIVVPTEDEVEDLRNTLTTLENYIGNPIYPVFEKSYTEFYRQNEAVYDVIAGHTYIGIRADSGGGAMFLNVKYTGSSSWSEQYAFRNRLFCQLTPAQNGKVYFGSGSTSTVAFNGDFALFDATGYSDDAIAAIKSATFDAIGHIYNGAIKDLSDDIDSLETDISNINDDITSVNADIDALESFDGYLGNIILPVFEKTYTNFYRQNEAIYDVLANHSYVAIRVNSGGSTMYVNVLYQRSSLWDIQKPFSNELFIEFTSLSNGKAYFGSASLSTEAYNGDFALFDVTNYSNEAIDRIKNNTFDAIGTFSGGELGRIENQLGRIESNTDYYVAIGDSITAGSAASVYSKNFYWQLFQYIITHSDLKYGLNLGVAGAQTPNIEANCGAKGLYITSDISMPDTTTGVVLPLNIGIKNVADNLVYVNPCSIDGIKGTLSYTSGNYVFTRAVAGTAKTIAAGTSLVLHGGVRAQRNGIMTIFVGTNDALDTNPSDAKNIAEYERIKCISDLSNNGKYIVIGPYKNSVNSDFRALLSDKFGQRYFDLYAYFSGQGVLDVIAEGLIESGSQSEWETILLANDGLHPNDTGHQLIYERIRDRMIALGWIS